MWHNVEKYCVFTRRADKEKAMTKTVFQGKKLQRAGDGVNPV